MGSDEAERMLVVSGYKHLCVCVCQIQLVFLYTKFVLKIDSQSTLRTRQHVLVAQFVRQNSV